MIKSLTILLFLALLLTAIPTATFATNHTISNEAEEHILNELNRANIPNAAIAVIQGGETSYILKDSAHDTLFMIGSVSKSFTAFGVLLLEDMGLLSVNDPVHQHLPWFEVYYNGVPVPHDDITVYNLLQHTSGLINSPSITSEMITDDFISQFSEMELAFYPSSEFIYGNVNYVLLGLLIETVSGQSYSEFMTQQVLQPLGLYNTFADMQNAHETGRVIGGNRPGFLLVHPWNPPIAQLEVPTGFIYSDISDLARWAGIHLGTVEITEQFARVVQRSHEDNHSSENPFVDKDFFYAAGWFVHLENGEIEHGGLTHGYSTIVSFFPHDDIAVIALGNLLRYSMMHPFRTLVLDVLEDGTFSKVGMDLYVILDIIFAIITALGIVCIVMFAWLVIKLIKKVRNGTKMKFNLTISKVAWLIIPVVSLLALIAFYIVPYAVFHFPRAEFVTFLPASITTTYIALWIIVLYSWCSWLARVFVNPQVEK